MCMSIHPAERELLCQRCQNDYEVWYVHNDFWNLVAQKGEGFFCPTCFTVLAKERGHKFGIWKLTVQGFEQHQDALDSIPISNRPHPYKKSDEASICYTCQRSHNDGIHAQTL